MMNFFYTVWHVDTVSCRQFLTHTHTPTHTHTHTHTQHPNSEAKVSHSHSVREGDNDSETAEAILKYYLEQEIGKIRTEFRDEIQRLQDQVHQLHTLVEKFSGRLEEVERKQSGDSFR